MGRQEKISVRLHRDNRRAGFGTVLADPRPPPAQVPNDFKKPDDDDDEVEIGGGPGPDDRPAGNG
jgi:hypothetical protein